jgi:hypothetical protein
MQVLVLVAQNAVGHSLVGTATSANSFFREIGASLGTAVVGAIFVSRLTDQLATDLPAGPAVDAHSVTPALVRQLPEAVQAIIVNAYAESLTPLFLYMAPLFLAGFALVLLPKTPLGTAPTPAGEEQPTAETSGATPLAMAEVSAPVQASAAASTAPFTLRTQRSGSRRTNPGSDRANGATVRR